MTMESTNFAYTIGATGPASSELDGSYLIPGVLSDDLPDHESFLRLPKAVSRIAVGSSERKIDRRKSALDVATYILEKSGEMSTAKLQLLLYYCQAWSLVWDDMTAFDDQILAGPNGPVVDSIAEYTKGEYSVSRVIGGSSEMISDQTRETVDVVVSTYRDFTAQELASLAQREKPWLEARDKVVEQRQMPSISLFSMAEYYRSMISTDSGQ